MRAFRRLILAGLCLVGGAAQASPECPGKHVDFGWVSISKRNVVSDLTWALEKKKLSSSDVIAELGKPVRVEGGRHSWVYGMHREGRTCLPSGGYESTYLVKYAIVEVRFRRGELKRCDVEERTFITTEPEPDPFQEPKLPSSRKTCEEFLRANPLKRPPQ